MERDYLVDALILKSFPLNESDRVVTLFSRERGRLTAIAKGAVKPKSSLRGLIQPPRYCHLALTKGRGSMEIITQGEMIEPYLSLHNDLLKIAYANYVSELLAAGMPENKVQEDVFLLALATYSLLDLSDEVLLAARFFELRLLKLMGLFPDLEKCSRCGRRLEGGYFYLSPRWGALVCASCHGSDENLLSAGTVKMMRKLSEVELNKLLSLKISKNSYLEMEKAIYNYLDYHLEYSAKARNFLKMLLAEEGR